MLDQSVYSAPVIKEPIPGGDVQISGNFSIEQAHQLAIVLRQAPCRHQSRLSRNGRSGRRLDATRFIRANCRLSLVRCGLIFMAIYYNGAGLLADFGLTLNILLLVCVMAALQPR